MESQTDFELFESLAFPSESYMTEMTNNLNHFRVEFEKCISDSIALLSETMRDAKSKNENYLSELASEITKLGIGEEVKALLCSSSSKSHPSAIPFAMSVSGV